MFNIRCLLVDRTNLTSTYFLIIWQYWRTMYKLGNWIWRTCQASIWWKSSRGSGISGELQCDSKVCNPPFSPLDVLNLLLLYLRTHLWLGLVSWSILKPASPLFRLWSGRQSEGQPPECRGRVVWVEGVAEECRANKCVGEGSSAGNAPIYIWRWHVQIDGPKLIVSSSSFTRFLLPCMHSFVYISVV